MHKVNFSGMVRTSFFSRNKIAIAIFLFSVMIVNSQTTNTDSVFTAGIKKVNTECSACNNKLHQIANNNAYTETNMRSAASMLSTLVDDYNIVVNEYNAMDPGHRVLYINWINQMYKSIDVNKSNMRVILNNYQQYQDINTLKSIFQTLIKLGVM